MGEKIEFAVVGAGVIGRTHVESIQKIDDAKLAMIYDKDIEKAKKLAEELKLPWCSDFHSLLNNKNIDVVNICTPTGFHAEPAIAALESGKHVIVEKPMEINLERTDKMIQAANKANRFLGVIFQYRYLPAIQFLKNAIDHGKLGKITLAEASLKWYRSPEYFKVAPWRGTKAFDGGGALMNQAVHFIDLLLYLMGPIESVMAYSTNLYHQIEVEDTAVACLRFRSGALGVVQSTTTALPRLFDRIEIAGTEGSVLVENGSLRFKYFSEDDGRNVGLYGKKDAGLSAAQNISLPKPEGHIPQFLDFISAIKENRPPAIDGLEGQKSLKVILAAYESNKQKREIAIS